MTVILQALVMALVLSSANCDISPCYGLPDDDNPEKLLCQGLSVSRFPFLTEREQNIILEIYIFNTYIRTLPEMNQTMFPNMQSFHEADNYLLSCSAVLNWVYYQPDTLFKTECSFPTTVELTTGGDTRNSLMTTELELITNTSVIQLQIQTNHQWNPRLFPLTLTFL